ncbi:response regulator transcription factor [Paenibacillus endoradicis]|uniref:response regulator transcription factor n=1 Tax=Paenibacillus endoradicis TaxID=2972487 RepID=UPI00280C3A24|nr:response regulator [Paenibacillus endoradicis]
MLKTILIVDDEPRTRDGIRKVLDIWSGGKYRIETAANGIVALEWLEHNDAHLLISDIRMPELTGLELVERLDMFKNRPNVILVSGYSDFSYAQQALRFGVVDYLLKPIDKASLIQAIEKAMLRVEEQARYKVMAEVVDTKRLEASQHSSQNPHINAALTYIHEHLSEQITMKEMSDYLHMNASYFSVLFKEQVGLTFSDYVTRGRMQLAKELLLTTNDSMADIAEQVGYQTDKYFGKVFRTVAGISPAQYRKEKSIHNDTTIQ